MLGYLSEQSTIRNFLDHKLNKQTKLLKVTSTEKPDGEQSDGLELSGSPFSMTMCSTSSEFVACRLEYSHTPSSSGKGFISGAELLCAAAVIESDF